MLRMRGSRAFTALGVKALLTRAHSGLYATPLCQRSRKSTALTTVDRIIALTENIADSSQLAPRLTPEDNSSESTGQSEDPYP